MPWGLPGCGRVRLAGPLCSGMSLALAPRPLLAAMCSGHPSAFSAGCLASGQPCPCVAYCVSAAPLCSCLSAPAFLHLSPIPAHVPLSLSGQWSPNVMQNSALRPVVGTGRDILGVMAWAGCHQLEWVLVSGPEWRCWEVLILGAWCAGPRQHPGVGQRGSHG